MLIFLLVSILHCHLDIFDFIREALFNLCHDLLFSFCKCSFAIFSSLTRDETKPFAVFGVRACDARSFELLDRVFLNAPVDTFYAARREAGTIITLACERPDETCFCSCFGIDPAQKTVVGLKSMQHFRAAFEPIAGKVIVCDSGALCTTYYDRLPYRNVPRPIYPLDKQMVR